MKKEELFNIIGEVDEQKVAAAGMAMNKKKSRPVWVKWGAMAACLCLVVAVIFPILHRDNEWTPEKPAKLHLEGAVLQTGDGSLTYHTDRFDERILAFTLVLENEISDCYLAFTADNILKEWTDNEGVIHRENELFKVITPCESFEVSVDYAIVDNALSITVNGKETEMMPTTPGTYEVVIDYSELYNQFDIVEESVEVCPFGTLVINSSRFE